jgi:hypothetical protein
MAVSGKPRRFLVFYGSTTNKMGGWGDYFRSFDALAAAQKEITRLQRDYPREVEWWHIVDAYIGVVAVTNEDKEKV